MPKRRVLCACLMVLLLTPLAQAQGKKLTIDAIYDPEKKVDFSGRTPIVRWIDDESYLLLNPEDRKLGPVKVQARTGKQEPLMDRSRLEKALTAVEGIGEETAKKLAATIGTFNEDRTAMLINSENDLYHYDIAAGRAVRLTRTPAEEVNASYSPDGKRVAFTREFNLYTVDVATGAERALTTEGDEDHYFGELVWVYEEELYGRGNTTGYWWSPDSSTIAYLSLDQSKIKDYFIVDDSPTDQKVERTRYPQVGDPNPDVRLGWVSANGGTTTWVDLSSYEKVEPLVVRVGWTPDSRRIVYEVTNRPQSWLDLNLVDPKSGAISNLFREQSEFWIEVIDLPEWLPDGSFLWQSDRTGWRHIYHYGADGKLIRAVTSGDWDVRNGFGAAPDGWIYFSASKDSFISDHVYRVRLDGTGMERLTTEDGHHTPRFSPNKALFVDIYSTITQPPRSVLRGANGTLVRVIEENPVPALAEYDLGTTEFVNVTARDGFTMEALMIKPPNFDPKKKYPVLSYTYAGPYASQVRNRWGGSTYLWHQMLAQMGYVIWVCDNRTASSKGYRSAWPGHQNLGELELRDLEDGIAWLKKQPFVDGDRIGLWGWSYGGYMTLYALTHSKTFKVGIAGAPVTDWRLYDSIYTERYMGLLDDNEEGYKRSSVLEAAGDLHGKLLLIHGAIDNNVHFQNSLQLIKALQTKGKDFEFMLYPESRHGVTQPLLAKHLRMMMTRFIVDNL